MPAVSISDANERSTGVAAALQRVTAGQERRRGLTSFLSWPFLLVAGAGANANPVSRWRTVAKHNFITVGAFSIFVNLLMLTLPLYLFQLSDRVLTSRSLDTLRPRRSPACTR